MNIIYVFVVLAAVRVGTCYSTKNILCTNENQTATGDEVSPIANKYPWTVGVYNDMNMIGAMCTGSLISSKHVLISQNCAARVEICRDEMNMPIEIRLGDNANNTVTRGLFTVYRYEQKNFRHNERNGNIAILQLDRAVAFGLGIQPICLPVSQSVDYSGKLATATGWYDVSRLTVTSDEAQQILKSQEIHIPIWTNEDCAKIPHYANKLTNNMICAGEYENGVRYACIKRLENAQIFIETKDGKKELVGIYSFGTQCGTVGVPAVYTRVTNYLPWIHGIVKDNKC